MAFYKYKRTTYVILITPMDLMFITPSGKCTFLIIDINRRAFTTTGTTSGTWVSHINIPPHVKLVWIEITDH